jgi:fatty acid desaturase
MWKFIGRLTMDYFAGASLNSWLHQHTIGHHVYTNVVGADPDLPYKKSGDLRRVSSFQDWLSFYKLQHIYLPFLYGFLAFKFRIQDITDTLLSKTNGAMRVNPMGYNPYVQQVLAKTFWAAWRLVLPLVFWKIPIGEFLLLFVAAEMATGWWLTFNFQVSHVSPQLAFPMLPESGGPSEEEWAKLQVKTTVDYAHGNWLTTFLCGALNYQTVHHLFPCVSQYHYPALSPIVARVAKKHKIKYNQLSGGFWKAFGLHYRHLVEMGLQPERPH